jgi:vacuolar-type H+-ATPase catalytic subunit A/Vma1
MKKVKYYKNFLESLEDGYSEEFDKKWQKSEEKIKEILSLSNDWVREELILMKDKELDKILSDLKD